MALSAPLHSLTRTLTSWFSTQAEVEMSNRKKVDDEYVFVKEIPMIPPALYNKFIEVIDKQFPNQTENQELKALLERVQNSTTNEKPLAQAYIHSPENTEETEKTEETEGEKNSPQKLNKHSSASLQATPSLENQIKTDSKPQTRATDLEEHSPHDTGEVVQIEEQQEGQPTQQVAKKEEVQASKAKTETNFEDALPWHQEDFVTSQRYSNNQLMISKLIKLLGEKQLTKDQFYQLIIQLNPSSRSWLPRVEFNYHRLLLTLRAPDRVQSIEAQSQLLDLTIDCFIFACGFMNNYSRRRHLIRLMDNELGIPFVQAQPRVVYRCSDYDALVFGNLARCFISPLVIKQLTSPQVYTPKKEAPKSNAQGKNTDVAKPPADAVNIDGVYFYPSPNGTHMIQNEGDDPAPLQLDDLPADVSSFQLQDACEMIQQGVFSAKSFVAVFNFLRGAPLISNPTTNQVFNGSCRDVLKLQPILCLNLRIQTEKIFKQQALEWVQTCDSESELIDSLSMINDSRIRMAIIEKALNLRTRHFDSSLFERIRPDDFQHLSNEVLDKIPLPTKQMGLMKAAKSGNLTSVKKLAEHGIDLNYTGSNNYTALHCAAASGELEVVKYLHKKQPESHHTYANPTPLYLAAGNGNLEVVKYLTEEDPKLLYCPKGCPLPVHRACEEKQIRVIKYFINRNPEFLSTATGFSGLYPLHYLAMNGDIAAIKAIERHITLEHLTKKNDLHWTGTTPKDYAKDHEMTKCYDYLVQLQRKLTPRPNCPIQ